MPRFTDVDVGSGPVDRARIVFNGMSELLLIRRTQFLMDRSLVLLWIGLRTPSLWAALLPT